MYIMSLTEGYNINALELEMRSDTLREYLCAVNHMFKSQGFKIPVNWDDKSNTLVQFVAAVREWENKPPQRTHMTPKFLDELIRQAKKVRWT